MESMNTDDSLVTRLQPLYLSKLDGIWKSCAMWELTSYLKYGYRIKYQSIDVQPAYMLYP